MADIGKLPPLHRIPPGLPATGVGQDKQAPQRKPAGDDRRHDQRRQRKKDDGDASHIDEYA